MSSTPSNRLDQKLESLRQSSNDYKNIDDGVWTAVCNKARELGIGVDRCELFVAQEVAQKREFAEKDKVIAQKDKMIAEKDKVIGEIGKDNAEKDKVIGEIGKDNAEKDKVIGEKDKVINATTIGGLLKKTENFQITKSLGTLSESHVDKRRDPAKATKDSSFSIQNFSLSEKVRDLPSCLLATFRGKMERSYGCETDVQHIVQNSLDDAVTIVNGWFGSDILEARQEAGLFSNRPDHSVICLSLFHQTPVCVVETKQPFFVPPDNIHEKVWGQTFDYVSFLRVLGHPSPFVVLTTFLSSYLTWDASDNACNEIIKDQDDRFSAGLREKLQRLLSSAGSSSLTPKIPSPLKEQSSRQVVSPDKAARKRLLSYSGPYESSDFVKLLVNVIFCSIAKFVAPPAVPSLLNGCSFAKYVLALNAKKYEFKNVRWEKIVPWSRRKKRLSKESEFCLVSLLGTGRTSKVFRAVSMKHGIECVVKMYVRKFDEANKFAAISKATYEKDAITAMKREKQMYMAIYNMDVPIVTLLGHKCLILPFFRPIEKGLRPNVFDDIKQRLQNSFVVGKEDAILTRGIWLRKRAKTQSSYRYSAFSTSDQKWRHCGYLYKDDGTKELYLFDLAELEEMSNKENHNRYVESHVAALRSRNQSDP